MLVDQSCDRYLFLHGSGVAELDFAIFVGERTQGDYPRFQLVAEHIEYRSVEGELELRSLDELLWHATGDHLEVTTTGLVIKPGAR